MFDILLLIIAFIAGVGAIAGISLFMHVEDRQGSWFASMLIPLIAIGIATSSLLSGRDLRLALIGEGSIGAGSWLLRMITYVILGICLARLIGQAYRRRNLEPASGALLFGAFTAYYVGNNIVPSILGTHPTFIHNLLYPIFLTAAVFVSRRQPLGPIVSAAKIALVAMMIVSLIVAVVQPKLAVQPYPNGWIPWLHIRLWGVGSNANSIGPLALVYLLLEYMQPSQRRTLRWIAVSAALIVFIFAQSKTVWLAALFALPLLAWFRQRRSLKEIVSPVMVACFCAVVLVTLAALLLIDPSTLWSHIVRTQAGIDITTITGRERIWQIAFAEWKRSPLFGYGPGIWDASFRWQIGMPFAYSAHNQFLQSLSGAGLLGLVTLAGYLVALGSGALRAVEATRGVSVVLFLIILLRCMTETPLVLSTLINGDFLTHILLLQLVLHGQVWYNDSLPCNVLLRPV